MSSLNLNKMQQAGHLTKDPEMKYTPTGKPVTTFTVASSKRYTGSDGEKKETTLFLRWEAWGKTAEAINQYFSKGRAIYVEGELKVDPVEKDGKTEWYTKAVVREFHFVDSKGGGNGGDSSQAQPEIPAEGDIPF